MPQTAKCCGSCHTTKPASEFFKDRHQPDGLYRRCKSCHLASTKKWKSAHKAECNAMAAAYRKRNPDKVKATQSASNKKRYAASPETFKTRVKAYVESNREKVSAHRKRRRQKLDRDALKAYFSQYYIDNAERLKERARVAGPAWAKANPGKVLARSNRYRAAKLKACPSWADSEAIERIYAEAAAISEATGVRHHVDHIVPLQGKIVRGLHVDNNLQILPAVHNQSKGARLWPDMP